ncbi:MAG: hypothetical protein H6Q20_578 [Bacteroidetes bacterium]|nr:hypothetical protein [Bacteroidota bacterium]
MKVKVLYALCITVIVSVLYSCSENNSASGLIEASKTSRIKKGEPVVFKVNSSETDSVTWKVTPATNTLLTAGKLTASVTFGAKGTYEIAAVSKTESVSVKVSVIDSLFNPGSGSQNLTPKALTGDVITIIPSAVDSLGTRALSLMAVTTKKYDCFGNYLISTTDFSNKVITISFSGVYVPESCNSAEQKTAIAYLFIQSITEGDYQIKVHTNGNSYSGLLNYSNKKFTFTWPDTKEIVISPLKIE